MSLEDMRERFFYGMSSCASALRGVLVLGMSVVLAVGSAIGNDGRGRDVVVHEAALERLALYLSGGVAERRMVLPAGSVDGPIVIDRLPGVLDASALQVSFGGQARAYVAGFHFERLRADAILPLPERMAAEAQLRRLVQAEEDLLAERNLLAGKIAVHKELRAALLRGIGEGAVHPADVVWELFAEEQRLAAALRDQERGGQDELEHLQMQRRQLEGDLQAAKRREQALNGRLTIQWTGELSGDLEVRLTTPFGSGGWSPQYRLHAQPARNSMELTVLANLRNDTGESWQGVPVELLTARTTGATAAPALRPVFLVNQTDKDFGPRPVARMMARRETDMLMMAAESGAMEPPAPEVERLTTQFRLNVRQPVTVPALSQRVVQLERVEMEMRFWSSVTPMLDTRAYLHGEAELNLAWPLLPGSAELLVDGISTGRTHLEMVQPSELLELGFGENPGIHVEWRNVAQRQENRGMIDRTRVYLRHYETTVRSSMTNPHEVRLTDRFPVSRDAQIKVRQLEPSRVDVDENGVFEQTQTVSPGGQWQVRTRFEVTAPRDWRIPTHF